MIIVVAIVIIIMVIINSRIHTNTLPISFFFSCRIKKKKPSIVHRDGSKHREDCVRAGFHASPLKNSSDCLGLVSLKMPFQSINGSGQYFLALFALVASQLLRSAACFPLHLLFEIVVFQKAFFSFFLVLFPLR
jgi:hypothetical protein